MDSKTDLPLISIVVPTWNRKDYLRICIQSLLAQSYPNCEIVIVDDGSTDGTGDMIAAEFPQVRYIYQENAGTAAAKNHAVQEARGEYVVFNDSDDVFLPHAVESLFNALPAPDALACCYGTYHTIDADGNRLPTRHKIAFLPSGTITGELLRHIIVTNCGTMIPRKLFLGTGGFDRNLKVAEDYQLFLKLAVQVPFYAVQEPIYLRRRHQSNLSSASYAKMKTMFSVFADFVTGHPELQEKYARIIRERYADFHNKLYREAKREGLREEALEHIRNAWHYRHSFKMFWRYLTARFGW